jgi:hypothetical protein
LLEPANVNVTLTNTQSIHGRNTNAEFGMDVLPQFVLQELKNYPLPTGISHFLFR